MQQIPPRRAPLILSTDYGGRKRRAGIGSLNKEAPTLFGELGVATVLAGGLLAYRAHLKNRTTQ
jgi:hypothetical protein